MQNVGILGLGMYLPPAVRRNDWWPADVVARWQQPRPGTMPAATTPGMAAAIAAMAHQASDPFQGAVERRVMESDATHIDLEERAARDAIARAEISPHEIDVVLTCATAPDYLLTNPACALHHRLGLARDCLTLHTDGAQHAFLLQLSIAHAMIAAGHARCALLVQSSAISRLLDYTSPISPLFGDGATAAVVGHVSRDRGVLSAIHRTDGSHPNTLIASVPDHAWYAAGRAFVHIADPAGMRDILLRTVDLSSQSISAALEAARHQPGDVDVFAMHQGMPWLRRVVQDEAGLGRARAVDTFAATAHLFAAFVPSTLAAAEAQDVLGDGDLVVIAGGGNGMTYGATVVRWGRS